MTRLLSVQNFSLEPKFGFLRGNHPEYNFDENLTMTRLNAEKFQHCNFGTKSCDFYEKSRK